MSTYTDELATWAVESSRSGIPDDVWEDAKLRTLDIIGTSLAASTSDVGEVARQAALNPVLGGGGSGSHLLGYGDETSPAAAAVANGTLAHALDFDDTHNETMIHVSAPIVTTALTYGEAVGASGKDVLSAVCIGREVACRMAMPAPGAFHERGFHATGVFGALGAAVVAGKLSDLSAQQVSYAVGIAGSQAAGLLEFFSDGTWVKRMHPGWAAHSGIWAAELAGAGFSGPPSILEGRFGLFNSHLGPGNYPFQRITEGLSYEWVARSTSFKPYPCGHVIHQFIDALKLISAEEPIDPDSVTRVTCRIADWMVPIVCEPVDVKKIPVTDYHAKFSLQYSVAAAIVLGHLGVEAYNSENIRNPAILALAQKVHYEIDESAPDTRTFKGWVIVETTGGRREEIVDANWGSLENPMTPPQVREKFERNAALGLGAGSASAICEKLANLETVQDIRDLLKLCERS
jgi:2-methylcitrate dehydratase PrpD